jgi:hypothetical protein
VVFVIPKGVLNSFKLGRIARKDPFLSMAETPVVMLIGAGMIVLGTLVAVWIAVSIVRQNRKDHSFPE